MYENAIHNYNINIFNLFNYNIMAFIDFLIQKTNIFLSHKKS